MISAHGAGRLGAVDHTRGTPVTTFVRDAASYRLDPNRDHDGYACKRR